LKSKLEGTGRSQAAGHNRGSALVIADRTMFEIYREATYGRLYRVVYFTELGDHDKETEIGRAMAGEHVFDGFIRDLDKVAAKQVIARFVDELNHGAAPDIEQLRQALAPYGS
jgi:hypothetical protein